MHLQWNLCNSDALGLAIGVLIIKVSLFSRFARITSSNAFIQVCTILLPIRNYMHAMYTHF